MLTFDATYHSMLNAEHLLRGKLFHHAPAPICSARDAAAL